MPEYRLDGSHQNGQMREAREAATTQYAFKHVDNSRANDNDNERGGNKSGANSPGNSLVGFLNE
jgi:hypothetical protein